MRRRITIVLPAPRGGGVPRLRRTAACCCSTAEEEGGRRGDALHHTHFAAFAGRWRGQAWPRMVPVCSAYCHPTYLCCLPSYANAGQRLRRCSWRHRAIAKQRFWAFAAGVATTRGGRTDGVGKCAARRRGAGIMKRQRCHFCLLFFSTLFLCWLPLRLPSACAVHMPLLPHRFFCLPPFMQRKALRHLSRQGTALCRLSHLPACLACAPLPAALSAGTLRLGGMEAAVPRCGVAAAWAFRTRLAAGRQKCGAGILPLRQTCLQRLLRKLPTRERGIGQVSWRLPRTWWRLPSSASL